MNVAAATSTTLFKGAVPPNAFMVRVYTGGNCLVNHNGPASANANTNAITAGFNLIYDAGSAYYNGVGSSTFITPPGYKPMGPVSIWCYGASYVAARGW